MKIERVFNVDSPFTLKQLLESIAQSKLDSLIEEANSTEECQSTLNKGVDAA